jgi:hypothetical protein
VLKILNRVVSFRKLSDRLVVAARHVCRAVGEEPVNNKTQDWEQEDTNTPQHLVGYWAVRFQDLHCRRISPAVNSRACEYRRSMVLTEDEDIQDKNNETDSSATSTVLPCVTVAAGLDGDWGGHGEAEKRELDEHAECGLEHDC